MPLDNDGNIIVTTIPNPDDNSDGAGVDDAGNNTDIKTVSIDDTDYNLDDNGNALDSDGKIFKTVDEIAKLKTDDIDDDNDSNDTVINIDDVEYKLNETGDAIDKDGNIKFTKDEISKLNDDSGADDSGDDELDMSSIIKLSNIKPTNDKGEFNEYENTSSGLANYISDVQDQGNKQGAIDYMNNLTNRYPIIENILNHLELNDGNFDTFKDNISYKNITIDSKNENQVKSIIIAARKARGENDEQIDKYYNYLKDSDNIKDEVKIELKYLQDREDSINTNTEQQLINKKAKSIVNSNNYWGVSVSDKGEMSNLNIDDSIYDIIVNKKSIKVNSEVYKIPEKIRVSENGKIYYHTPKQFFDYLYEPIPIRDNNNQIHYVTKDEIKINNENSKRTNSTSVLEAFKRFVNYDTSQFINEQVNKINIDALKSKKVRKYTTSSSDTKPTGKVRIV